MANKKKQLKPQQTTQQSQRTGPSATARWRPIVVEPAVVKRISMRSTFEKVTSNGSIAAAAMVFGAILAVIVANSPAYEAVREFVEAPLGITIGDVSTEISVEIFVNDLLMSLFFLLVGIELKYEMTVGELTEPRKAALPMLAAVGGVAVPALIYLLVNSGGGVPRGWAVPIATDIAFALGVMSLMGSRVRGSTKVFFSTLAIADDILAIIVIAVFYGQTPDIMWCAASLAAILILVCLNMGKIYSVRYYTIAGSLLWICMFNSGIHATLAGVIIAFALPSRSDIRLSNLGDWLGSQAGELEDYYDDDDHILGQHDFTSAAARVERVMHHVTPPLQRVEHNMNVFVNFIVLPLFAFVNAQVRLVGVEMGTILVSKVAQGAFFGAVLGKPLGIILVTFVLVKCGFSELPKGVTWPQIISVGLMGGIGFTMSILIAGLRFTNPADVLAAKCAILVGSVTSAALGASFLMLTQKGRSKPRRKPARRSA